MHAIEEFSQKINGEHIQTFKRKVKEPGTVIEIEAGTNGFRGTPCREGGSRSYVRVIKKVGDMFLKPVSNEEGIVVGFECATSGDAALGAVIEVLRFAGQVLEDQISETLV